MANLELDKAADEANRAFGRYKARLAQEGIKLGGDTNYRNASGISGTASVLRDEWIECMENVDRLAGAPAQISLPTMAPERPNPLGLILDQQYRRIDTGVLYAFRSYNDTDGVYTLFSTEAGGLRGPGWWIQQNMALYSDAGDSAIAEVLEYDETEAGKYPIKRVGPERFVELLHADSSKLLAKKNPTAKSIEMLADQAYVVTATFIPEGSDSTDSKLFLTPCREAEQDESGTGFFKCNKIRYKMGGHEERIVIKIAPVDVVVEEPIEENPPAAETPAIDAVEFVKSLIDRGFTEKDGDEDVVVLAPKSFEVLRLQVSPELMPDIDSLYVPALDFTVLKRTPGAEMEGYEEIAPEIEAEAPQKPDLHVEAGGAEAKTEEPSADELEALDTDAAKGLIDGKSSDDRPEGVTGDLLLDWTELPAEVTWSMVFTEHIASNKVIVNAHATYFGEDPLICLSALDEEIAGRTFAAFRLDGQKFEASMLSWSSKAMDLAKRLAESEDTKLGE